MGLLGSPATFGRMMDFIMRFLSCITYQDDVLIHSKTHAEQLEQLQLCFDRIRAHGLKLNVKKCSFGQSDVPYLGFLLTPTGILPGKEKTEAIRGAGPPQNFGNFGNLLVCVITSEPLFLISQESPHH